MFRNPNSTEWPCRSGISLSVSLSCPIQGLHHQHRSPCRMTTLISTQLSALFEVSQPALPFRCLFHSQESFPKDFLEAAGVANVTISQYTRGHSPLINSQRHIQEWETLAWSLQALAQKLGLDYHCAVSAAAHPTFISITESTDCKLPQQIITGHSKTLKTKLASTKDRRMLCKFGDFFVEWWYCLDFF